MRKASKLNCIFAKPHIFCRTAKQDYQGATILLYSINNHESHSINLDNSPFHNNFVFTPTRQLIKKPLSLHRYSLLYNLQRNSLQRNSGVKNRGRWEDGGEKKRDDLKKICLEKDCRGKENEQDKIAEM